MIVEQDQSSVKVNLTEDSYISVDLNTRMVDLYISEEVDIDTLYKGVKLARKNVNRVKTDGTIEGLIDLLEDGQNE